MIPKEIFFYWGNETMSFMRYCTLWSFRKFNPNWKMILYKGKSEVSKKTWSCENNQDFHSFDGKDYQDKIQDLNIEIREWECEIKCGASHQSNFLKWQKLHETGGVYCDLDILFFKSFDEFYNTVKDRDCAFTQTNYISIGLMAGAKDNEFFKDIYHNTIKQFSLKTYQSAGVMSVYKLFDCNVNDNGKVLERAKDKYKNLTFYNIPMSLVYFLDSNSIERAFNVAYGISDFPETAIGYHWYAGHPIVQKYNNLINDVNYKNIICTFTKILGEIW